MKLRVRSLVLAGVLALLAAPAFALTATDNDFIGSADLGYVASGDTLEYDHVFDPFFDNDITIHSVDEAWLYVAIVDDWNCPSFGDCLADWFVESEVAAIDLNEVSWQTGQATATILWGEVSAEADLLNSNGTLHVRVNSTQGDFAVLWSQLITTYDYDLADAPLAARGDSAQPMPEPSAALVFAIGAVVMRGTIRRRQVG